MRNVRLFALPVLSLVLGSAVLSVLALSTGGAWARTPRSPAASAARVISAGDSSELHLIKAVGETSTEEGKVTGTLPGSALARLHIDAAAGNATSSFTFHLRSGAVSGHASGRATTGQGGWESFSGRMVLNHGTGRYAHASGSGTMYGALNRRNDRLKVQVVGQLHY
jgi:hypothetical protein